jgi:hypothetical protein
MKIKIDLPFRSVVKAVEDKILLPNGKITVAFNSSVYAPFNYLKVFIRHNGRLYNYNVRFDEEIDLTPILKAGELEMTIHAVIKGAVVKQWEIQPVIVEEVTPNFQLKDLIKSLEARVAELEEQHKPIL